MCKYTLAVHFRVSTCPIGIIKVKWMIWFLMESERVPRPNSIPHRQAICGCHSSCQCPECCKAAEKRADNAAVDGVISLLEGERMNLEPARLIRHERNEVWKKE